MSLFSLDDKGTDIGTQSSSGSLFSLPNGTKTPPPADSASVTTPAAKPSIFSTIASLPKTTISQNDNKGIPATDVRARFVAPIDEINPVFRPGRAVVDTFKSVSDDLYKRFDDLSATVTDPNSTAVDKIAKAGSVGVGIINAAFQGTGIPEIIAAASQTPGVAPATKAINDIFGTIGQTGGNTMSALLGHLNITDDTRKSLEPVMREIGGLIAQVVAGGAVHEVVKGDLGTLTQKANDIVHNDPNIKLAVQSAGGNTEIPIRTPNTNHADYARSQGYEPYTSSEELPTIDAGKGGNGLPTAQIGPNAPSKMGSFTVEPVKNNLKPTVVPEPVSPAAQPNADALKTSAEPVTIDRPVAEDGSRVTKAANDINQTLVEKGFDQLPAQEQARYTPQTKADQIQRVSTLMTTDMENARQMVTGDKAVPAEIQHQVLFNAMQEHAIKNSDAGLLRDLAKSPLATKLSEAAQALGAHGYSDNPNSPVEAIRAVEKSREITGKAKAKIKASDIDNIKKEVASVRPKKQTWAEFIKSVQC